MLLHHDDSIFKMASSKLYIHTQCQWLDLASLLVDDCLKTIVVILWRLWGSNRYNLNDVWNVSRKKELPIFAARCHCFMLLKSLFHNLQVTSFGESSLMNKELMEASVTVSQWNNHSRRKLPSLEVTAINISCETDSSWTTHDGYTKCTAGARRKVERICRLR